MRRKKRVNQNLTINRNVNTNIGTMSTNQKSSKGKVGVMIVIVLLIALAVGGYYFYQKKQNQEPVVVEIEMSEPSLPRISMLEEGYIVNNLLPYTTEMDLLTMRDTISPLTPQGQLTLLLEPYGIDITEVSYQIFSIDGTVMLKEDSISEWQDNQVVLKLQNVMSDVEESVLVVKLVTSDEKQLYYYTRLVQYGSCYLKQNLDFVSEFHTNVYSKNAEALSAYIGGSTTDEVSGLDQTTLDSSIEQVIYEGAEVEIVGEVTWDITECTSLFISTQLEYQIDVKVDGTSKTYNVKEFFRTGYNSKSQSVQIRQYNRTTELVARDKEIEVETINGDDTHVINDEKTFVGEVENRALYLYNIETSQLVEVFTLEEQTGDVRDLNQEYDIRILSVSDTGNMAFIVYGYMNRGDHEGQVGTSVYYYDVEANTLEQKAFVANNKSFAVGQDEMSQGVYYSNNLNKIFVIAQESFYEINLENSTQTKLAEEISDDSYMISEDGKMIAYQEQKDGIASKLSVLNFETGASYEIETLSTEIITPLGYFKHDLIYGIAKNSDTLFDEAEQEITPMYMIGIRSGEGEVLKTFEADNQYIRDISITDNMMTMNLVHKEDGAYVYGGQDFITNNEIVEENTLEIKQSFIKIAPQLIANEEAIAISYDNMMIKDRYYAYAYGGLQVESAMASEAIQYASANTGAVINENQEYVWRSGSRDLKYSLLDEAGLAQRMTKGESAIEIVSQSANHDVVSYTGCTSEQMCYLINQEQLIAAKLDDGSWILLVGYNGDTMYYRDQSGERVSISMSKLDNKAIELIGDGRF